MLDGDDVGQLAVDGVILRSQFIDMPSWTLDDRLDGDGIGQLAHVETLPDGCQHNPSDYDTRQLYATSSDGTQVTPSLDKYWWGIWDTCLTD